MLSCDWTYRALISDTDILRHFKAIKQFSKGSHRAPHKPLLLLMRLAAAQQGQPRMAHYSEIEPQLECLLQEYNRPIKGNKQNPQNPFWYLKNDQGPIWDIAQREALERTITPNSDIPGLGVLRNTDPQAGLTSEIYDRLRSNPNLLAQVARMLLSKHFPQSLHVDILSEIGLDLDHDVEPAITATRSRDPKFRYDVIKAYRHRCAVCGYDGRLGHADIGLEAAHVKWHAFGGEDAAHNGLALCSLHHKLFDHGAIGLSPDYKIRVSDLVNGSSESLQSQVLRFKDQEAALPIHKSDYVLASNIEWHTNEVFKAA